MFRDGEQSRRLMHEDATSDEEAEEAREREEREEREGAQEEEEEEEETDEEDDAPIVKRLAEEVSAVITTIELNEDRYLTPYDVGNVTAYMQEHNMWQGVLNHLQLSEMPIAQADIYAFLKKILKRRRLERRVRRRGERRDEWLRIHGYRTDAEGRRFLDGDKDWMTKIVQHYVSIVEENGYKRRSVGSSPWHGENPNECEHIKGLSVYCSLDKHKDLCFGFCGPERPLWRPNTPPKKQTIDELMQEGRVFIDGRQEVWVMLTENEFSNSYSGKHRKESIDKDMERRLLTRVYRTPPHISGMRPFREYRPCAYEDPELAAGEDPELAEEFYTEGADDEMADGADGGEGANGGEGAAGGMSEGGNRAQKKHKTKHKCKTKRKTKTKPKCKTKCKTKTKPKTKPKSKCKTKSKSKNRNH